MENKIKEMKISFDTLNKLVKYLATKPYVEVNQLFEELKQCTPINEVKETEIVKDEPQND